MKTILSLALSLGLLASGCLSAADNSDQVQAEAEAERHTMLEEAERARAEAESARHEAEKVAERARETARMQAEMAREEAELNREQSAELAQQRAQQEQEMAAAREELSRTHRELREASREVARAHRDLTRADVTRREIRVVNLGERPVIGVVLGNQVEAGVEIIGVSPDGPAEKSGIKTGDVLVSIRGENLQQDGGAGRDAIFQVMGDTEPGEDLALVVDRDGESWQFTVKAERREPRSWQSMVRIPEVAPVAEIHNNHEIIVDRIEMLEIDEEAIAAQVEAVQKRLEARKFIYIAPDGEERVFEGDFEGDFEFELHSYSDVAEHAMREANVWFGLPQAQGLELATINEGLGAYFKTERGVLVIKAREDNAYELESGDVILQVAANDVDSPADLMRALREIEPGDEIEIHIKRDRRNKTLKVTMPENRFGQR